MHWKFLRSGAVSPFTGLTWVPGTWVTSDVIDGCRAGIHACRPADLPYWLCDELWVIEFDRPPTALRHKVVGTRARLVDRVAGWNGAARADLGAACLRRAIAHTCHELRTANLTEQAEFLAAGDDVAAAVKSIRSRLSGRALRQVRPVLTYLEDVAAGRTAYPVASIAYITARLADALSQPPDDDQYRAERAWQADWLVRRLALTAPSTG